MPEEKKEEPKKRVKKETKECPFCMNNLDADSTVCPFCDEPFDDLDKVEYVGKTVNRVTKWSKRKKWGLILMLVVPAIMVIWLIVSTIFWLINASTVGAYNTYDANNY